MEIRVRHPWRLLFSVAFVVALEVALRAIAQLAPAFAEMILPLYFIVGVAGLVSVWHSVRGRAHDRRAGDRRHEDRRHHRAEKGGE